MSKDKQTYQKCRMCNHETKPTRLGGKIVFECETCDIYWDKNGNKVKE